ncbi:hypothetical protein NITMOv2_3993 [Nitrospira moscoviensis]|jgi:hypothetical protein|uniref:Uncharacterized protein n=2 Tax=Nitrospira moscoviensis TaxID=42253 RepID=A0A0K2GID5_NITMO|nr:hypothetical protein NITMOv2_3993 [Nitrospira moscoviensis]
MHRAVIEYDRTVSYVEADLLLLNIARARHHRPVHFTAVSSVAATFDFRTSAGIRGGLGSATDAVDRPINLEYGVSVAENPTITIVPITGEEFTKRVLRPLDEDKFEFLVHQGYDINMVLRLMARGMAIETEEGPRVLFNQPSQGDGFVEFRQRLLQLASLDEQRQLHIGPVLFEESQAVRTNRAPNPDEVVAALEKGFRWEADGEGKVHTVRRKAVGRLLIANYDPNRLPNEERRRLHEEAQRYPPDYILVDVRPGFPGGEFPLRGSILLRSLNAILGFVARSIDEEPESLVPPDPRTKMAGIRNPAKTLEIEESASPPDGYEFSVQFDGRYYSIRKFPVSQGMVPSWNQEAFAVLSNLFQMTVTDLTRYPTPAIAIAK